VLAYCAWAPFKKACGKNKEGDVWGTGLRRLQKSRAADGLRSFTKKSYGRIAQFHGEELRTGLDIGYAQFHGEELRTGMRSFTEKSCGRG
jgi:hypothetical protein